MLCNPGYSTEWRLVEKYTKLLKFSIVNYGSTV